MKRPAKTWTSGISYEDQDVAIGEATLYARAHGILHDAFGPIAITSWPKGYLRDKALREAVVLDGFEPPEGQWREKADVLAVERGWGEVLQKRLEAAGKITDS